MADPYAAVRQLALRQQEKPSYIDPEATGEAQSAQLPWWTADWGALADTGFASKYNEVQDLSEYGYPGMFRVTLQNPDPASNHKYDTLDAIYKLDPATGQATLVGEPTPTRQTSTAETVRDFAEHGIPIVAGGIMAGTGLGGYQFGMTGAGGAAAGGALTGSGMALATGGDAQDALKGGLFGAAGGLVKYGAQGLLDGGATTSNFGNPEIDNLIPQVDANGNLLGQLPDGIKQFGTMDPLKQYDTSPLEPMGQIDPEPFQFDEVPGLLDPYAQTVDINSGPGGTKQLGTIDPLKQYDTSPLTPMGTVDPINIPSVPSIPDIKVDSPGLLDKVLDNPKLIGSVVGAVAPLLDGGGDSGNGGAGEYTGPMPTITRGGWSPTATPTYMQLPTTDYQLPTTGYANSGLWRFGQQPQTQPATQQPYQMPQAPQPFTPQPMQQPLMQQPQPMQQQGLLGTQQQPQQQGLMSQGFGRPQQRQQGSPADLFSLAQQKGWIDQSGAPVGNWQNNVSQLVSAAKHMGLNAGGIDQAFGQPTGTAAGYLGRQSLGSNRDDMMARRAGRVADQEARTQNAGFNRAMSRDNGNGTTGRDTYNAYLMRNGIDWQY